MIKTWLKKSMWITTLVVALVIMLSDSCSLVTYARENAAAGNLVSVSTVQPRSAIIEYRYKVVNGDVYRRLYNYTEQCWIGSWELFIDA